MGKPSTYRTNFLPQDPSSMEEVRNRFMANVEVRPGECWLWQASTVAGGYGQIRILGEYYRATRVAYEMFCGPIGPGRMVCHTCDTPQCVNPQHLWLGSAKDNGRDAARKGRTVRGSRVNTAKLTERDVVAIRAAGGTQAAIAARFGVSRSLVGQIRAGVVWKHVGHWHNRRKYG